MRKTRSRLQNLASRLLCHFISVAITGVLAVFAAPGAIALWPTHPKIACSLAVLCAIGAGIGHLRLCAQFGGKRPTQSRLLLLFLIAIFGTVSVNLGAIGAYRESGEHSLRTTIQSTALVVSFFGDLLRGRPEAVVPFFIGGFLEFLPLATLLLTVSRKRSPLTKERTHM
jgi:hypothetical protein